MRRHVLILALVLIPAIPCTAGEIITLPLELPDSPLYMSEPGYGTLLAFDAERALDDVSAVRLHVTGSYSTQRSFCWLFGGFGGGVWTYPEDAGLSMGFLDAETTLCLTRCEFAQSDESVDFDLELGFDCGETPDWSFLAGGSGVVLVEGLSCEYFPSYPEVCGCDASAAVTSAVLVIELDVTVPADETSWGALKARYR